MSSVDKVITNPQADLAMEAKSKLSLFVNKLDKLLAAYFAGELEQPFGPSARVKGLSRQIWQHIAEHNLRPAKRLRASFLYYGYQLLGGEDLELALEASMSVELVHTALLMHDDFMDADKIRRGQPTSQVVFQRQHQENNWRGDPVHFGEAMAVDVGDIALLAGYEILASSNFPPQRRLKAMQSMLRGIVNTGIGQAFDLSLQAAGGYEKDVFDLHWAKTAIYTYENPLHVGAILAGGKKSDLALLSQYARSGGVAFQLQDDILGLFGNPQETGKSDNSDLVQGKVTQLVVKAIELADSKQKQTLLELWGKEDLSESEAEQIRKIVKDTGSLEHSRSSAIKFAQEARVITASMRKLGWNKEAVDYLEGIAVYMIERSV